MADFFPEHEETEFEKSQLNVPIYRNGELVETLQLDALLRLDRYKPVRNALGLRQFEFRIREWEVGGHSPTLGGYVSYTLSDVPQPHSVCLALQPDSDYPAVIVYNAIYDLYIGGQKVVEKQPGVGVGTNVTQIPPRDVSIAFGKPFNITKAGVSALTGVCDAMTALTPAEFTRLKTDITKLRSAQ